MDKQEELVARVEVLTRQVKLLAQAVRTLQQMTHRHAGNIEDLAEQLPDKNDAHPVP